LRTSARKFGAANATTSSASASWLARSSDRDARRSDVGTRILRETSNSLVPEIARPSPSRSLRTLAAGALGLNEARICSVATSRSCEVRSTNTGIVRETRDARRRGSALTTVSTGATDARASWSTMKRPNPPAGGRARRPVTLRATLREAAFAIAGPALPSKRTPTASDASSRWI
jgi:hypothetical protein